MIRKIPNMTCTTFAIGRRVWVSWDRDAWKYWSWPRWYGAYHHWAFQVGPLAVTIKTDAAGMKGQDDE